MDEQPSTPVVSPGSTINPAAPPPVAAATPVLDLPTPGPGAFGAYKYSKQAVNINLGTIVVLLLLTIVAGVAFNLVFKTLGEVIGFIATALFSASTTIAYLASVKGEHISIGQALSQGLTFWVRIFFLNLLVALSVMVSALLLIIPLFFVMPRLALASYFLIDQDLGMVDRC